MAEIGADSGSSYPDSLDTDNTLEVNSPAGGKTVARAAVVNDLAACIVAIETTLGVNPEGGQATVVARLDQEHNSDGTHDDSLVCVLSGVQTHTGAKQYDAGITVSGLLFGVDNLHDIGQSGALRPKDFYMAGSIQSGDVPLDRFRRFSATQKLSHNVTVTSAVADILTMNVGSVTSGDMIFLTGKTTWLKGATGGQCTTTLVQDSGTATVDFDGDSALNPGFRFDNIGANETWTVQISTIVNVTGTGTLVFAITGRSAGSDSTASGSLTLLHAVVIKGS